MGTNVYMGRTTASELRDRIRKLGGTPRGRTKAALLDELEQLIGHGEGGSLSPEDVIRIADERITRAIAELEPGAITPDDIDEIFGVTP